MRELSASEILDVVEYLRRGCKPTPRPIDEIVVYTQLLEQLFASISEEHGLRPNFKYFHETFCPHWSDLLEEDVDG